ncbi:MAG: sugar ABC transporter permease [Eubacteriales bacterium]
MKHSSEKSNMQNELAVHEKQKSNMRFKRKVKENLIGYSFIGVSLVGFLAFMVFPLFYSLVISFMNWNMFQGFSASTFIGWKNYAAVLKDDYFITGFWNNIKLAVMIVPALLLIALILAYLLNGKIFGRGALRAAYFMPYIAITTASALVFSAVFNAEFGPVNEFLRAIGVENPPGWAMSVKWALPVVALFIIWKNIGYCVVIYLASLQGISESYYEAASIDGANKIQQFRFITVPLVSPTTFFLVITNMIMAFRTFEEVQMLTGGGPGTTTYTMILRIYTKAFSEYDMGFASAAAWIYFCVVMVITIFQFVGQKKWVKYT